MKAVSRQTLAEAAIARSIQVRSRYRLGQTGPLDIYALCDSMGIQVRFVGLSMEGLYVRGTPPRVILSALRPLPRRNFTCAHEVGHHEFGHSSTIDELTADRGTAGTLIPDELVAQVFAGYLLMPVLGVRSAFAKRGCTAETASPIQVYAIACSFGVGYATLVQHIAFGLQGISKQRARDLLRITPARLRLELLGHQTADPLVVVDRHWAQSTVDLEVGTRLLLPLNASSQDPLLRTEAEIPSGQLYRATRPGIARISGCGETGALFARICRKQYVGLSRYRHLEDDDEVCNEP